MGATHLLTHGCVAAHLDQHYYDCDEDDRDDDGDGADDDDGDDSHRSDDDGRDDELTNLF